MSVKNLRIGVFDIEMAPAVAYIWDPRTRYVPEHMLVSGKFMLCWALVDATGGRAVTDSITPEEVENGDDSRIVESAIKALEEYDVILGHNLDKFDLSILNGRAWVHGIDPLSPKQTIDTLKGARQSLGLMYNSLDSMLNVKFEDRKVKMGFDNWRRIMEEPGERKQPWIDKMTRYCSADVVKLRRLYHSLVPYLKRLPRLVDSDNSIRPVCPTCGSDRLTKNGTKKHRTKAYTRQEWKCGACGRYSSSKTHNGENMNPMRSL